MRAARSLSFAVAERSTASGYSPLIPWLGLGLLLADGERWKAKRRLITPAFHFKVLQNYTQVNVEQTEVFLQTLCVTHRGFVRNFSTHRRQCALRVSLIAVCV